MSKNKNMFQSLVQGAKPKENVTPVQTIQNGVVKPVEKTFLHSLPEYKLVELKKMAADKRTTVRSLINAAIDERYFK